SAAYGVLAVIGVGLIAAWWTSWRGNAAYIENVAQGMETVRRQVQETPNRASSDLLPLLPALQATRRLAAAHGPVADVLWSLGFGLY
ncbi:MAG TPA: hypothetical protein VFZ28_04975, partial [Burkholderiaceae bacterium]|nr:hypothetical protein [Burkholderiaceae bacterium]